MQRQQTFEQVLQSVIAGEIGDEFLQYALEQPKLKSLFERLLAPPMDHNLWDRIALAAKEKRISRERCFEMIIHAVAEAWFDSDPAFPQNAPNEWQTKRNHYLELSGYARALADYYSQSATDEGPSLARFYQTETEKFQKEAADILGLISGSKAERQSTGKKFRREHLSFIRSLVPRIDHLFGSPHYEVVAVITNAAFELNAGAEDVRSARRGLPGNRHR
jgi:hypothetical protein